MSVLKTTRANPSRMQGIFKYLLHAKEQREKKEVLEQVISPDKLECVCKQILQDAVRLRQILQDDPYH